MKRKIVSRSQIGQLATKLHRQGKRVVFTNGVFDILHAGHVQYLARARKLGDVLIVGLNTDASVRMNKGDLRPIVSYKYRAILLASLEMVDYVVPLERKTPDRLIERLRPAVLVKGSDYRVSEIVGANFVKSYGGRVIRMSMTKGLSTSEIIRKIQNLSAK